jgi:hypothetical protein
VLCGISCWHRFYRFDISYGNHSYGVGVSCGLILTETLLAVWLCLTEIALTVLAFPAATGLAVLIFPAAIGV